MDIIAHIRTDFPTKFGLPRQSGLVDELCGTVVFEPEFRRREAFRGLDGFDYIWLLWEFSETKKSLWSATVRPPRLGGNKRMGVFATRSPFRPNPIGLSCVRLDGVEFDPHDGPLLRVSGIDLMDGTPIFDIKPYIPLTDCHPDASDGFTSETVSHSLKVDFPNKLLCMLDPDKRDGAIGMLMQDPRPGYNDDPTRQFGVSYSGFDIRFSVSGGCLTVTEVIKAK